MNLPGAKFRYNFPRPGDVTFVLRDGSTGVGSSMEAAKIAAFKQREENQEFAVPVVILVSGRGPDAVRNATRRAKFFRIVLKALLCFCDVEVRSRF